MLQLEMSVSALSGCIARTAIGFRQTGRRTLQTLPNPQRNLAEVCASGSCRLGPRRQAIPNFVTMPSPIFYRAIPNFFTMPSPIFYHAIPNFLPCHPQFFTIFFATKIADPEWSQMDPNWSKLVQIGSKCSKLFKNWA